MVHVVVLHAAICFNFWYIWFCWLNFEIKLRFLSLWKKKKRFKKVKTYSSPQIP